MDHPSYDSWRLDNDEKDVSACSKCEEFKKDSDFEKYGMYICDDCYEKELEMREGVRE